ncbi:MAG: hypothetical protein E7560_02150 [Ruminococcaceae bacterium]|nr:hypothetical protein [Oscillospiraceae bacterium]
MDNFQRDFITLIDSALTGKKGILSSAFDYEKTFSLAKKHVITSLIYFGALNCGVKENSPLVQMLFFDTCRYTAIDERQKQEISKLTERFNQEKIDYMLLKGTLLKPMYPNPVMRVMGDADILIKTEQYEKIQPIMEEFGYELYKESDHEFVWKKSPVTIELHKRLISTRNKDFYSYFGDGWKLANPNENTSYSMTDEDQMIYLFTHFAKHYRAGGIGIRHIIDVCVYRKNKPDLDEEYVKSQLKLLGLDKFYENTLKTLSVWFDGEKETDITEFITQFIFDSGVYGNRHTSILSSALKGNKKNESVEKFKTKKFLRAVFVPLNEMCLYYKFLQKAPFLLPFMWVYHLFKRLFKKDKLKRFSNEMKLADAKSVDKYQKELNFVGLDFNFKE